MIDVNESLKRTFLKIKETFERIGRWVAKVFASIKPAFVELIRLAKSAQRIMVRDMGRSSNERHATAAKVWMRTKNGRIKRKTWKTLLPAIQGAMRAHRAALENEWS